MIEKVVMKQAERQLIISLLSKHLISRPKIVQVEDIICGHLFRGRGYKVELLDPDHIVKIYAEDSKVFTQTDNGTYQIRLRLYEAEERLDNSKFVRISNSEIVNLKKVKSLDLSFVGTICMELSNGTVSYVSRRYVSKIKKVLGL